MPKGATMYHGMILALALSAISYPAHKTAIASQGSGASYTQYGAALDHRKWCEEKLKVFPEQHFFWQSAIQDAQWRVEVWRTILDLNCQENQEYTRESVWYLHQLIGDQAYFHGAIPAPVPHWRMYSGD